MEDIVIPMLQGMAVLLILGLLAVFICEKLKPEEIYMASRDMQFQCPKCGGSAFGSTQEGDDSMTRYCHGDDARDSTRSVCSFTFPMDDDWRYFLVHGKHVSKAQYAAALKELQDNLNRQIDETNRRFPTSHSF